MTEISNKKIDIIAKEMENDVSPDIHHFFSSLSRTVDKFDAYNQAIAKKRILDVITEIEIAKIQQQQQIQYQPPPQMNHQIYNHSGVQPEWHSSQYTQLWIH